MTSSAPAPISGCYPSDPEPLVESWSALGVLVDLQKATAALKRARDRSIGAQERLPLGFAEKVAAMIGEAEMLEAEVGE